MAAEEAHNLAFDELGIRFRDSLQFRLDDDDCLCADCIETMRWHARPLMATAEIFAASLTGVMFSVLNRAGPEVYDWPVASSAPAPPCTIPGAASSASAIMPCLAGSRMSPCCGECRS